MKYKTLTYEAVHAYTSYNKLSVKEADRIASGNFNDIPDVIETDLGNIDIADDVYMVDACENPGKTWNHNKKSDWYTHVPTGVKVKKVVKKSPDYDKPNGEGVCETTLAVKIPLPSRRGQNPNSHHNRIKTGNVSRSIRLSTEEWELLGLLGNGSYSQGIKNTLNSRN
jgi:hypothetical protein